MEKEQDIFSFIEENKTLVQDYVELRIKIFKLELIKKNATIGGLLVWFIILLFLLFGLLFFAGLTLSFWLASIFKSSTIGFGITSLLIVSMIIFIAVFRKTLFINPIIRIIIQQQTDEE